MIGLGDVLELRRQQEEEINGIEADCDDCNYCDDCQKQCEVKNA